jgi:segregation and condensation protein B
VATETERALEAILMVAQEPVEPHLLAQLLEVAPAIIDDTCRQLAERYQADERGFELVKVAGGYRFQSAADLAPYVERFALEGQSARLSAAALETLAIVAYKQPLSRAQVAAIRGVNVDGVMRTLQQRGYIEEVGRDPGPGQATLFGTSREFLERMGLDRIEDLPPIADLFPSAEVMEALEATLRAEARSVEPDVAPAAAPQLDLRADGAAPATAPDDAPAAPGTDAAPAESSDAEGGAEVAGTEDLPTAGADVELDDDELPEPEPPAWALDPPEAAAPADPDPEV